MRLNILDKLFPQKKIRQATSIRDHGERSNVFHKLLIEFGCSNQGIYSSLGYINEDIAIQRIQEASNRNRTKWLFGFAGLSFLLTLIGFLIAL